MALTRITSGGIAEGVVIKFDSNNNPATPAIGFDDSNSGILSSGGEISIATGGQKRLSIDGAGKLSLSSGTFLPVTNSTAAGAVNVALYVNQSDANASDAADNDGTNLNRPFKTIERALLEAARRSYVSGDTNDKFEAFTVLVMPGDYTIDNRPGYDVLTNPIGSDNFESNLWRFNPRNGGVIIPRGTSVIGYDLRKTVVRPKYVPKPVYNLTNTTSDDGSIINDGTYKLTQIMFDSANMIEKNRGYIQEQTRLYLEQSSDALAGSTVSAIYATLTQEKKDLCVRDLGYIVDAIIADLRNGGNANSYNAGQFYTDGTANINLPGNEKPLTVAAFEYARNIAINALYNWPSTQPVGFTFTQRSGTISRTTFTSGVDFTVGDCADAASAVNQLTAVITTIINNPSNYSSLIKKTLGVYEPTAIFKVTGGCYFWQMTFKDAKATAGSLGSYSGIFKNTSFSNGVPTHSVLSQSEYNDKGQVNYSHHRVIAFTYADQRTEEGELETYYSKIDAWDTAYGDPRQVRREEYEIVGNSTLRTQIDTVNSASPYIFNCSLRSVLGLNGMWADGSKVQPKSFKSMVVAQFTGISLQRDSNCFWQPKAADGVATQTTNPTTGEEKTQLPIYADPDAEYKQGCRHFHIKATDSAFIQVVSVFAVGYADQFLAESGGDMSITNSNSNFGQISLRAVGHQFESFEPANQGRITALVPPRGIDNSLQTFEISGIDARTTWQKNGYPIDPSLNYIEFSAEARNNFVNNQQTEFKLYLDIASINSEDDIPELEISAKDNLNGTQQTKRYFLYNNGNLALFRDYYSVTGTTKKENCTIQIVVDNESGGQTTYSATVKLSNGETGTANAERQGYFFDDGGIYLILDNSFGNTKNFIFNFLFKTTTKNIFKTTTQTEPDGTLTVVSGPATTQVLEYSTSFPAPIVTRKYVDSRGSTPSDLIWRVEYTIDKNCPVTPKPPEKRFIIKGTRPSNGLDGVPFTNYRFSVLDVEEVQAWEKGSKNGVYYLTVIRADVDKFVDWYEGSYLNKAINIQRGSYAKYDSISEFNNNNINFRSSSNINYLYPSTDEEGLSHRVRQIWNPPQMDSRVLVEKIANGFRPKDLSVPNKAEFVSKISNIFSITPANPTHKKITIQSISHSTQTQLVTVTTSQSHGYTTDSVVYVRGTNSNIDGYRDISTVPSPTTFTIYEDEFESGTFAAGSATSERIDVTVVLDSDVTANIQDGSSIQISGNSGDIINNIHGIYNLTTVSGRTQFKINVTNPSTFIAKTVTNKIVDGSTYKLVVSDPSNIVAGQYISADAGLTDTARVQSISGNTITLATGSNAADFNTAFDPETPVTVYFLELGTNGQMGYVHRKPFADVPSMLSVTAEAVHRLVEALDLRYVRIDKNVSTKLNSAGRVNVAPTTYWDDRGYTSWEGLPVYGNGKYVYGPREGAPAPSLEEVFANNQFGINDGTNSRRIPVISPQAESFGANTIAGRTLESLLDKCPKLPLYRPSILRASSHTWEYIGLGSGNYSTGFPNLQTRVLKGYEQFILQSYENGGGFVASTGTNSNGDQYVGNQVVQAGGQSTFTLNVPKVRKSSESNFLEIISYSDTNSNGTTDEILHNIENRISNAVVNVTASEKKNSAAQAFLKGLSNFFTTSKLSVTDRANIQSVFINDTFAIANSKIANGEKFPEGSPDGFGFTKGAKPEKTGFISTDTNDRLYVSPKFLDAWRLKRQLVSASNINLDNNRIYISSLNRTALSTPDSGSTSSVGLTTSTSQIKVVDTVGIPSNGKIDIEMTMKAVSQDAYYVLNGARQYLNPSISITLEYDTIDYTNNTVTFKSNQNKLGSNTLSTYISNILPTGTHKAVVANWSSPFDYDPNRNGVVESNEGIVSDGVLFDSKFLKGTINNAFNISLTINETTPQIIPVNTASDFYNKLPDRGAVVLRYKVNTTVYYSTFVYYKNNGINAIRKVTGFSSDQQLSSSTYPNGTTIFFAGCSTSVTYADRWAAEGPFIPSTDQITEDVDLESATLFTPYEKPIPFVSTVNDEYINNNVPNPITSKALGINLQTRQAIKKFAPLTSFGQISQYCNKIGFTSSDEVELLFKPGYYKLNESAGSRHKFTPVIKINGSGIERTNEAYGKETANTSAGKIGGYSNDLTKRADSVNFYKTIHYTPQYVQRTDRLYITTDGYPQFNGGVKISNVNFLGLNEAITVNEILDSSYSSDPFIQRARRDVRKAWYVKKQTNFPTDGRLSFTANGTVAAGKAGISFKIRNDEVLTVAGVTNTATSSNARFIEFTFTSSNFTDATGTPSNLIKFGWLKEYVIPGTTLYFGADDQETKVLSRIYNKNESTGVETLTYTCALYTSDNDFKQNKAEDLVLPSNYSNSTDYTIKFANVDGDEFVTLVFNLGIYYRTQFMPSSYTLNGGGDKYGYDEQDFDTPEIFGVVAGYRRGTVNLVIDSNPTQPLDVGINQFTITLNQQETSGTNTIRIANTDTNINNIRVGQKLSGSGIGFEALISDITTDGTNTTITIKNAKGTNINHTELIPSGTSITVTPKAEYPFATWYGRQSAAQFQYSSTQNEETAVSIPYFPNGFKSLFGKATTRFYLIEFVPEDIGNFDDNYNMGINSVILNYGLLTSGFDAETNFATDEAFIVAAKKNLNLLANADNPYRATTQSTDTINTTPAGLVNAVKVRGKKLTINWPHSYKSMRRKIATAHAPSIGHTNTPFFEVDAVPGSNVPLWIQDTTIGALSPFNRQNNTYGGGYSGGLIKARGSSIRFIGNRLRGNVSTNWSSLLYLGGDAYNTVTRILPSARRLNENQRFTYGHSVDFLQHEEGNYFERLPEEAPAKQLNVGKNDELFKYVSEYNPSGLNYLEPNYTADNKKVDYDYRVLPIKTIQRIPRLLDNGSLNSSVELKETELTANNIEYSSTTTGKSGWNLRYNDTQFTIAAGGSDGSAALPKKSLQFNYTDDSVVAQIFPNFTSIVKSDNKTTVYATVTKVTKTTSGATKIATIEYEGNLNFNGYTSTKPENVTDLSAVFAELSIKFSTQFIDSERYTYTGGATSRYQKAVANSASSYLILSADGNTNTIAQHSDVVVSKVGNGVANVSYGTERELVNSRTGTTNARIRFSTDSQGNITRMALISLGSGHQENDTLTLSGSGAIGTAVNGYSFKVNRTTSDDLSIFEAGEYLAVAPRNCFILNNINAGTISGIKSELQRAKMTYKPGSFIKYAGGSQIFYKVATSSTNQPYIGIYRYLNPNNKADIRTAIVVILEETTASPAYVSNQRFDLYDKENILDYWPTTGRITIGNLETCDYTLTSANDTYTLTLLRSNTKYYPSYVHDWEGLDITDSSDANVTVGDLQKTEIRLADPVDISANTFKRILPSLANSTSGLYNTTLVGGSYMDPYGNYTNKISVVEVPSGDVNSDFEKFDIGQIVTIPYRDLIFRDGYGDARYYGGYGPYSNITFEVTSAATAGSQEIVGKITSSATSPMNMNMEIVSGKVNVADNNFVLANHPYHTSDMVRITSTGTIPAGLTAGTDYYIIKNDYWSFRLATSLENAENGIAIDITSQGTGTHTINLQRVRIFWNLAWQPHMVASETAADTTVFNAINPLSTFRSKQGVDYITVGSTGISGITLYFDQALIGNIASGTKFKMVPGFAQERFHMAGIFKSRIIDVEKDSVNSKIKLYLAEELPFELTASADNTARHFGFLNINNGGWSFPRQNYSAYRTNNIKLGDGKYEIKLPNRSSRIKKGDILSYSYESGSSNLPTQNYIARAGEPFIYISDTSGLSVGDALSNYTLLTIPSGLSNATSITIAGHGLQTGDEIFYVAGRDASNNLQQVTGLTHKTAYFVRSLSTGEFELYTDQTSAYDRTTANRVTVTNATFTNQRLVRNSISTASLVLDATDTAVYNSTSKRFTINGHGLTDKEAVTYRRLQQKTGVTDANDGKIYYAWVVPTNPNQFYLRSSLDNWPTSTATWDAGTGAADIIPSNVPDYMMLEVKTIIRSIDGSTLQLGRFNENNLSGSGQIEPTALRNDLGRRSPISISGNPDLKQVKSSIVSVSSADSDGYVTITLDTPNNILYSAHPTKQDFFSVSDVIVSHLSDRVKFGGPTLNTFLYSRNGGKLSFRDFSINNTWFGNYFGIAKGYGPYGRLGWTGNFGSKLDGSKTVGSASNGSLELSWNSQRNNSIWAVSSPVRPSWSLWQWDWARQVSNLQPILAEYHAVGYDITYNRWWNVPHLERDGWMFYNPVKHISRDSDSVYAFFNTSILRNRREWWGGPGFWRSGVGAYDIQNYRYPSPASTANEWWPTGGDRETATRIILGCDLQDFEIYNSGWPNWGKGNNTITSEQVRVKYVQHYRPCLVDNLLTTNTAYRHKDQLASGTPDTAITRMILSQSQFGSNSPVGFGDTTSQTAIGRKYIRVPNWFDVWQYMDVSCAIYDDQNRFIGHFADWFWGAPYGRKYDEALYIELMEVNTELPTNWTTAEFRVFHPAASILLSTVDSDEMQLDATTASGIRNGGKVFLSSTSGGSATTPYVLPPNQQNIVGNNGWSAQGTQSGGIPFNRHYNFAFRIDRRGYNNTTQLSTEGISKPIARNWFGYRIIKLRMGDLCNFEWSPMNLVVTKYNRKIHNEESVISNSNFSNLGVNTIYI
jgi:hypothetical protein